MQLLGARDEVPELAQLDLTYSRSVWSRMQRVLPPGSAGGCTGWCSRETSGEGDAMDITDRLAGRVALVTGGSRGIGAEIVRRLAAEGADVGFTYHTGKDEAEQVAAQVRGLGRRAIAVAADLGDPGAAAAVVDAVAGEVGGRELPVNKAGITHR